MWRSFLFDFFSLFFWTAPCEEESTALKVSMTDDCVPKTKRCSHAGASHKGHSFGISLAIFADGSPFFLIAMEFKRAIPDVSLLIIFQTSQHFVLAYFSPFGEPEKRDRLSTVYVHLVKTGSRKAKIDCCLKLQAQHA